MSLLKQQAESKLSPSLRVCSIQALDRLDDALPRRGGPPVLLSPPIQMLIASRNTHRHTQK